MPQPANKIEKCECERGPVSFYVTITDANGVLLDRIGACSKCMTEAPTKRALESLGLSI